MFGTMWLVSDRHLKCQFICDRDQTPKVDKFIVPYSFAIHSSTDRATNSTLETDENEWQVVAFLVRTSETDVRVQPIQMYKYPVDLI